MMKNVDLSEVLEFVGYLGGGEGNVDFEFLDGCDINKVWVFKANAEALESVVTDWADELGEEVAKMLEYLEVAEYNYGCFEGCITTKNSETCVDVATPLGSKEIEMLELVGSLGYTLEKVVNVMTRTIETV